MGAVTVLDVIREVKALAAALGRKDVGQILASAGRLLGYLGVLLEPQVIGSAAKDAGELEQALVELEATGKVVGAAPAGIDPATLALLVSLVGNLVRALLDRRRGGS
jgi:hypothetical protein